LEATSATTAAAITTITATITPTIIAPNTTPEPLSHTGIALVIVGPVLLVAAAIAFLFLCRNILLKRRRDKATSQREPVELDESMRKSEMPVDSGNLPTHELIGDRAEPVELRSQMIAEMEMPLPIQLSARSVTRNMRISFTSNRNECLRNTNSSC
jgi:hypothetical protein